MSLLFSFGAVLVDKLNSDYEYLRVVVILLIVGVVTNGASVLFSVLGFSIKHYRYPLPYFVFFTKDSSTKKLVFNDKVIEDIGMDWEKLKRNQYRYSRNQILKIIWDATNKMQSKITTKRKK